MGTTQKLSSEKHFFILIYNTIDNKLAARRLCDGRLGPPEDATATRDAYTNNRWPLPEQDEIDIFESTGQHQPTTVAWAKDQDCDSVDMFLTWLETDVVLRHKFIDVIVANVSDVTIHINNRLDG